jgi:hypothetical protein
VNDIPKGCTCGYPQWGGGFPNPKAVHFHTYACQLRTGFNLGHALSFLTAEVERARSKFSDFNSPHEGWAVIREELDELWDHVKANTGGTVEAREEAIQIAAMALRYALDLTGDGRV